MKSSFLSPYYPTWKTSNWFKALALGWKSHSVKKDNKRDLVLSGARKRTLDDKDRIDRGGLLWLEKSVLRSGG